MKYNLLFLLLVGCSQFSFSHGSAKVVDEGTSRGSPYFTLECREPNGCYKYAAEWCPQHRFHVVGKKPTNDLKWQIEFACESGLDQ